MTRRRRWWLVGAALLVATAFAGLVAASAQAGAERRAKLEMMPLFDELRAMLVADTIPRIERKKIEAAMRPWTDVDTREYQAWHELCRRNQPIGCHRDADCMSLGRFVFSRSAFPEFRRLLAKHNVAELTPGSLVECQGGVCSSLRGQPTLSSCPMLGP